MFEHLARVTQLRVTTVVLSHDGLGGAICSRYRWEKLLIEGRNALQGKVLNAGTRLPRISRVGAALGVNPLGEEHGQKFGSILDN